MNEGCSTTCHDFRRLAKQFDNNRNKSSSINNTTYQLSLTAMDRHMDANLHVYMYTYSYTPVKYRHGMITSTSCTVDSGSNLRVRQLQTAAHPPHYSEMIRLSHVSRAKTQRHPTIKKNQEDNEEAHSTSNIASCQSKQTSLLPSFKPPIQSALLHYLSFRWDSLRQHAPRLAFAVHLVGAVRRLQERIEKVHNMVHRRQQPARSEGYNQGRPKPGGQAAADQGIRCRNAVPGVRRQGGTGIG
mmetsp:Transcript_9386/g.26800  ORF Transcript_9386/g.26800 Transcript_9386/m.26800 type:complete len:243 (+) Transcript_9386:30-758(+)